jgi:hypothetical protein
VSSCQGASQSRSSCCFRTAILQHIVLHFEDNRPLFFCQQTQRRSIHPRCIPTLLCPPLWLREHENVEGRLASCLAAVSLEKAGLTAPCVSSILLHAARCESHQHIGSQVASRFLIRFVHHSASHTPVDDVACCTSALYPGRYFPCA